jgi:hypothetical protein
MSMKKASEQFHIPYNSFREHCYGMRKSKRRGAKGVLLDEEERQLVEWLISMVERGYGLTPTTLKLKVSEITMSRDTPSARAYQVESGCKGGANATLSSPSEFHKL